MANESQQAHHVHQFSDLLQLLQYESNCISTHTGIGHNRIPKTNILSVLTLLLYACITPLSPCALEPEHGLDVLVGIHVSPLCDQFVISVHAL